jgi:hypothetical protein
MLNLPDAGDQQVPTSAPIPATVLAQLEVDNRMVVPAGEPIRLQVTAADVIHSFAVPSLWFKLDAVPGRINEKRADHQGTRRLLRPVLGTVRRQARLHADRDRGPAA